VAYWNLHERAVAREHGTYYVGENPLRAFHYSGYEPDTPNVLSKHTRPRPRVRLSDDKTLQQLFDGYGSRLLAEGWRHTRRRPYRYSSSVGGIPLVKFLRTRYRVAVLNGRQPPDPFEPASTSAFVAWIAEDFKRFLGGPYRRGYARLRSKG
jgi:hypothetical protein